MADVETYRRNRACSCPRCRFCGYTGPAVLITLGVLFLLDEVSRFDFQQTWPILLIVIGIMKVLQWSSPVTGHVDPSYVPPPPGAPTVLPPQPPSGTGSQVPHV